MSSRFVILTSVILCLVRGMSPLVSDLDVVRNRHQLIRIIKRQSPSQVTSEPQTSGYLETELKLLEMCALSCVIEQSKCSSMMYNENTRLCSLLSLENIESASSYMDSQLTESIKNGEMVIFLDAEEQDEFDENYEEPLKLTSEISSTTTNTPSTITSTDLPSKTTNSLTTDADKLTTVPFVPPTTTENPAWYYWASGEGNIDCSFTSDATIPEDGTPVEMPAGRCCGGYDENTGETKCYRTPWPCCKASRCSVVCDCETAKTCSCSSSLTDLVQDYTTTEIKVVSCTLD